MPIQFQCHACGLTLSVKEEFAGRACKCKCGTALKVPQASNLADTPAVSGAGQNVDGGQAQQPAPQQRAPQQRAAQPNQQQQRPPAAATAANHAQGAMQNFVPNPNAPRPGMQPMPFGQQEAPEYIESVSKSLAVDSVQCAECGKKYVLKPEHYGQVINCQCGAPVRLDHPLGYIPSQQLFAKNKQGQVVAQNTRTDDQILEQYAVKNSLQESDQKHGHNEGPENKNEHFFSFEENLIKGGSIFGGLACMIGGGVWIYLAYQAERLYWYPFVLVAVGLVAMIVGIARALMK